MSPRRPGLTAGAIPALAQVITRLSMWLLPAAKRIFLNRQLHQRAGKAEFERKET